MTATLEWAIGPDGQPRCASWFVGIDPRERPSMMCPCVGADGSRHEVIAKAGESGKVTPHFAHTPDSSCAATNPETAEHYNAKMRIASVLSDADGLWIAARCKSGHRVECLWSVHSWASVAPEFAVGTRRPDVALLNAVRECIGAIEVLHTHAVDGRKARDLAASGLRWIEVRSVVALEWRTERPLHIAQCDNETANDITAACDECAEAFRRNEELKNKPPPDLAKMKAWLVEMNAELARRRYAEMHPSEDEKRARARYSMAQHLTRYPPKLHMVTAFAVDVASRVVVIAAGAINGKAMHTKTLRATAADDIPWMMLDHALALVERHMPGKPAAFVVDVPRFADRVNCPPASELHTLNAIRRSVCDAIYKRNSVVIYMPKGIGNLRLSSSWLTKAQHAADEELRRVVAEASCAEVSP